MRASGSQCTGLSASTLAGLETAAAPVKLRATLSKSACTLSGTGRACREKKSMRCLLSCRSAVLQAARLLALYSSWSLCSSTCAFLCSKRLSSSCCFCKRAQKKSLLTRISPERSDGDAWPWFNRMHDACVVDSRGSHAWTPVSAHPTRFSFGCLIVAQEDVHSLFGDFAATFLRCVEPHCNALQGAAQTHAQGYGSKPASGVKTFRLAPWQRPALWLPQAQP